MRLSKVNPRWGYLRIVGELRKLGVAVSKGSAANVVRRHGLPPAPWRTGPSRAELLRAQAKGVLATDFFSVDAVFASIGVGAIKTPVRSPRANALAA